MSTALLGVDWGATNLRAFRFGDDGAVVETRRSQAGLLAMNDRAFEPTLRGLIDDWLDPSVRVVISGMAGSRDGWVEAPYMACPAQVRDLAAGVIRAPTKAADIWIAPGLVFHQADGSFDVMRGEEAQILGALAGVQPTLAIAPGTHSKWARVGAGWLLEFRTFMTGEMFALLRRHSILSRLMQGDEPDETAFALGVQRGLEGGSLLNLAFTARTECLFGRLAPEALSAYLSGVLIGSEIAGGLTNSSWREEADVVVIGAEGIADRYLTALAIAGVQNVRSVDGETAAAHGLWRIAAAMDAA